MTYLCVPIFVTDLEKARRDIATAAEAGADLIELRLDHLQNPEILPSLLRGCILPTIATCRPTWEGGFSDLDDAGRITLLAFAADSGAAYVDVELKTVEDGKPIMLPQSTRLILSSHDFTGRPDRLHNILIEMNSHPATINKIVWTARTIRDNLEAFEILHRHDRLTIALCMGEAGIISRILAKKFGAFLTFASLSSDTATASGQVTIADLKRLYRWDAITPQTKVFGVVACPVMHSMSPAIHNAAFDATGFDGVYLPMLVESSYESFKAFMESFLNFDALHLSGLSITIPHKENALRYLKEKGAEVEDLAIAIGAVNTIQVNRAGDSFRLRGINTDYAAILDSITHTMSITREELGKLRVAVIGAGGAARAAVAALAQCGSTVVVYNRTQSRADALAAEFNGKTGKVVSARMEKLSGCCCHVFINATSLGMSPHVDRSPLDGLPNPFTPESVVFDTVYNPINTKLLSQARDAGAKTITGVEMFMRQASAQFQAWTGLPAPSDVMRKVLQQRL